MCLGCSEMKPKKELAGFRKVALNPGEECRVSLELGRRQLRTLDRTYVWHVEPGVFRATILVADSRTVRKLKLEPIQEKEGNTDDAE